MDGLDEVATESIDVASSAVNSYERMRPSLMAYTAKLDTLIQDLRATATIDYHQVESRCKSVASFKEKCQRSGKQYKDPILDITDFVGIRIITYYMKEIDEITQLLNKEFICELELSDGDSISLTPDKFGYVSKHLIVRLQPSRANLTEWSSFGEFRAEIQIRTVLQHAWAAISHKLQYKSEAAVPSSLRRKLNRLSALLELADEEFDELRDDTRLLARAYQASVKEGDLDIEVNAVSLREYLDEEGMGETMNRIGIDAGWSSLLWNRTDDGSKPIAPIDVETRELVVPFQRVVWDLLRLQQIIERTQQAIPILHKARIMTIREIDSIIQNSTEWRVPLLKDIAEVSKSLGFSPTTNPIDPMLLIAMQERRDLLSPDVLDLLNWSEEGKEAVRRVIFHQPTRDPEENTKPDEESAWDTETDE